jgi:non-specific serine/threonine protein kinase
VGHPTAAPGEGSRGNLPAQLTTFVGRVRELTEVRALLAAVRFLTLTGTGGCGKTRLALEAAGQIADAYPDGVWLAELAPLADPALVPRAVALAQGVSEQPGQSITAALVAALRPKRRLLVLDNCEHLVDACAELVEALLVGCPELTILATSRELLGAAGETAWRVPSLATPDPQRPPPLDELRAYESVQLFAERARLVQPGFVVTAENAVAVAGVCQRLDGIPLALELAAARVTSLSVEQIAARLGDRFRLLTGGRRRAVRRQQTLRATLDWSHDLLTDHERALLRRLAVFAGGWTLEAAERVGAGEGVAELDVLDVLTRLIEKSLVAAEEQAGERRYRLPETIRQYAEERLLASGEAAAARDRHLGLALALAERAEPVLWGGAGDLDGWLLRLEAEHDNLRAALAWSLEHDAGAGLRLAVALAEFWRMARLHREGCEWLETLLARVPGRTVLQAYALLGLGRLHREMDEMQPARDRLTASAALFEALDDPRGLATALSRVALVAAADGDFARARALQERSLALFRAHGDRYGLATSLVHLGQALAAEGALAEARAAFEESLALFRALGELRRVSNTLHNLCLVALGQGDHARARALLAEGETVEGTARYKEPFRAISHHVIAGDLALAEGRLAEAEERYRTALPEALARALRPFVVRLVTVLGVVAIHRGTPARGVRLLAAVAPERLGFWVAPGLHRLGPPAARDSTPGGEPPASRARSFGFYGSRLPAERESSLAAARAALGEEAFAAAWTTGQALTLEAAAAEALIAEPGVGPPPGEAGPLSARELEVAGLIVEGLTNRQIAGRLVISPHTAERHVENILNKLGLSARAQIAAWAVEQRRHPPPAAPSDPGHPRPAGGGWSSPSDEPTGRLGDRRDGPVVPPG